MPISDRHERKSLEKLEINGNMDFSSGLLYKYMGWCNYVHLFSSLFLGGKRFDDDNALVWCFGLAGWWYVSYSRNSSGALEVFPDNHILAKGSKKEEEALERNVLREKEEVRELSVEFVKSEE